MSGIKRMFLMCVSSVFFASPVRAEDEVQYFRNVEVGREETKGDLVCIGGSVTVAGKVEGDVVAIGGDIEISGTVEGDAVAAGGRVRLRPGAVVGGDAVAVGGKAEQSGNAVVKGDLESFPYFHLPGQRSLHPFGVLALAGSNMLLALAGGLLFRRKRSDSVAGALIKHPFLSACSGLILTCLWVLLWIVDSGSRLGTILTWTGHTLALTWMLCGCTGIAWWSGNFVAGRCPPTMRWPAGALGISLVMLIPILGFALLAVITVCALGAAFASGLGKDPDWLVCYLRRRPVESPDGSSGPGNSPQA